MDPLAAERLIDRQLRAVQRIAGAEMDRLGYRQEKTEAKVWWIGADIAETAVLRLKRIVHSARKRTAL